MRILPINFNFYNRPARNDLKTSGYINTGPEKDMFISFRANTSAGNPLRKLKKLKCPYFGAEMISGKELAGIEKRLDSCANIKEVVTILKKYRKFMLKTEKRIFKRFEEFSKTNPDAQLQDCLKLWYDEAITKLKLDEFNVLDDVDKISLKLSPQNALAVHAKTNTLQAGHT